MNNDGFVERVGELEGATEGGELEVEGCGAKAIEPAFTDSDEVRIVAILVDDAFERGDTVGGEVPGMELDAIVLLLCVGFCEVGGYDNTHLLGGCREDGTRSAGSVGVNVGEGKAHRLMPRRLLIVGDFMALVSFGLC